LIHDGRERIVASLHDIHGRDAMSNPLDSLPATIGLGFVLTLVLYFVVKALV
jgi:hypothetical protein